MDEFGMKEPVLVTRWRLSGGKLPLFGRHMKALGARKIDEQALSPEFLGWVKQHIEWTLQPASQAQKDGVLMLVMDADGKAAMSLGPFEPLVKKKKGAEQNSPVSALLLRAAQAKNEAEKTQIAPELIWAVQACDKANQAKTERENESDSTKEKTKEHDCVVLIGVSENVALSGANSLLVDLAKTKGYEIRFAPELLENVKGLMADAEKGEGNPEAIFKEIFLVSDEHGVVPGKSGSISTFFSDGYQKLLNHVAEK